MTCQSFGSYFNENLDALDLPTWSSPAATKSLVLAEIAAMTEALRSLGARATMAELVGATFLKDVVVVGAAFYGSFYVGACIGSAFVATVKHEQCNSGKYAQSRNRLRKRREQRSAQDVLTFAHVKGFYSEEVASVLRSYPRIYNDDAINKRAFAVLARQRAVA